jgi:hypothetical protein
MLERTDAITNKVLEQITFVLAYYIVYLSCNVPVFTVYLTILDLLLLLLGPVAGGPRKYCNLEGLLYELGFGSTARNPHAYDARDL